MNKTRFYHQLQEIIPHWQAKGWIEPSNAQAILNDVEHSITQSSHKTNRLSVILGIMGVLLLGAGAISFFAANWQGMSKLLKLSLLFSSMISAYLAAAWALTDASIATGTQKRSGKMPRHPALGQAFLLLGVLLFGNNIMLIAQIYHIDSHYPNGVLLWALGALMVAIIMRSEVVLIASTVLGLLWTGMEIFDFRQVHWLWLVFWFISTLFVIRQSFHVASHFVIASLFLWLLFSFYSFTRYASEGFIVQIFLLCGIALFMIARALKSRHFFPDWAENLSRYALIFALIFMYVLSFPRLDLYPLLSHSKMDQMTWIIINLILMGISAVVLFLRFRRERGTWPVYKWMGILWLTLLFITLLFNVFLYQDKYGTTVIMINLLLFSLVIWLIYAGLAEQKQFYVNAAFVIFSIVLISRYFDTFWSLLDRSLFFTVGGLVLITGGYWLEKKRRQLSKRLELSARQQPEVSE